MNGGAWEIEEEEIVEISELSNPFVRAPTNGIPTAAAAGADGDGNSDVYVAVGKHSSSMDALSWALRNIVKPSSFVYLVHVFPEVHQIPTPLGMLPKSQVSAEQVESFMNQERARRRDLIQKFLNICHASKVQVDTLLVESDLVAKAVIELIPVLNVKQMIVGITRSNIRKLKGTSNAEQIYKSAPHYCRVKIICDGKEVTDQLDAPPPSHSDAANVKTNDNSTNRGNRSMDVSVSCVCFTRKFK